MDSSRRDLIASVTAGIPLSIASVASTKAVPHLYPGPASIGHRFIDANGLKGHVAEQGGGPLVTASKWHSVKGLLRSFL